jgi:uncharacterized protein YbbC (DUF1343 family)
MRAHGLWLLSVLTCGGQPMAPQVRPGIEVLLSDSVRLVRGKRLGLLSNQTGVDAAGRRDVDRLLAAGLRPVALFSPEHGFRGAEDRPGLPDAIDSATRLPIYSLFGGSRSAAHAALDSIDVLLIDLQDIGARFYTYPATATTLMGEAAARGKPVVVLDRPDPVGGLAVQGNVRSTIGDPVRDFVGFLPVPMRHGMTLGELLRLTNDALALHADLTVVPAAGWQRGVSYDSTGLPWIKPSPNMPSLESAFHYPGTCLFEGTNLSVGRGTAEAFQVVGAPWLDPRRLLVALPGPALDGVEVTAYDFTPKAPTDGKYADVPLHGLRLRVTDRSRYDPTRLAIALLVALRAVHPDSFQIRAEWFDVLAAGPELRSAIDSGRTAPEIWTGWSDALTQFRRSRAKFLLY